MGTSYSPGVLDHTPLGEYDEGDEQSAIDFLLRLAAVQLHGHRQRQLDADGLPCDGWYYQSLDTAISETKSENSGAPRRVDE
jgi:hypothetical protein